MRNERPIQLVVGLLLILLGGWFIALHQFPQLAAWQTIQLEWPFYVIGAGALILLLGVVTGLPRATVPASLVAGIGAILSYQEKTGDWQSWSVMWTLIPGFVGFGVILTGLLGEQTRHNLARGLFLIMVSAALFLVFALVFQRLAILGPFGPAVLLIALGIYIIGRSLLRPHTVRADHPDADHR